MRSAPLVALLCVAACSIEKVPSGRPPGPPTSADSLARLEEDSVVRAQVTALLRTYYERLSARDWRSYRLSFWPGATIATHRARGSRTPRPELQTVDQFIRNASRGADRLAGFGESMVHAHVRGFGDLAQAWVIYRARFGAAADSVRDRYGVESFQLLREGGEWRITALAFTRETPGRPPVLLPGY